MNAQQSISTITIKEALSIAHANGKNVTTSTLIKWVDENKLGHQPGGNGGKWYVFELKFKAFITGSSII